MATTPRLPRSSSSWPTRRAKRPPFKSLPIGSRASSFRLCWAIALLTALGWYLATGDAHAKHHSRCCGLGDRLPMLARSCNAYRHHGWNRPWRSPWHSDQEWRSARTGREDRCRPAGQDRHPHRGQTEESLPFMLSQRGKRTVLQFAASAEQVSEHPLARAIVEAAHRDPELRTPQPRLREHRWQRRSRPRRQVDVFWWVAHVFCKEQGSRSRTQTGRHGQRA